MGNVPISCCSSKSPKLNQDFRGGNLGNNNETTNKYSSSASSSGDQRHKHSEKSSKGESSSSSSNIQQRNQTILQHISEREPDDSDLDPSLNPLNRPIFASRSSASRGCNTNRSAGPNYFSDSYSSNSSIRKQSTNTPLTSSQDQGYTSCNSTNLTQFSGNLTNSSFDSGIHKSASVQQQHQQQQQTFQHSSNNASQIDGFNNISSAGTESFMHLDGCNGDTQSNSSYTHPDEFFECSGVRQKASSCSTIFVNDSTISQPDLDQTIKCVSLAIYYHIRNRSSNDSCGIFDESIHPLKMPASPTTPASIHDGHDPLIILDNQIENSSSQRLDEPNQEAIYNFVSSLFKAAQLTSEYAITTLVYLERLMTYAEMDLTPKTWRRMFLGAILLSSKVWEDHAVWNVDYAQILEEISVDDINELERQFLELIQFNMNVPSSVYAKYYFHLRTLALRNGLSGELTLLTVDKARDLEAKSNVYATDDWLASPIHRKSSPSMKRHASLEKLRLCGHTRAVLM